jgi:hypothetical protein
LPTSHINDGGTVAIIVISALFLTFIVVLALIAYTKKLSLDIKRKQNMPIQEVESTSIIDVPSSTEAEVKGD